MAYEQFLKPDDRPVDNSVDTGAIIKLVIFIVVGVLLFVFKYIAWQFPSYSGGEVVYPLEGYLTLFQIIGVFVTALGIVLYFWGKTKSYHNRYMKNIASASTKSQHIVQQIKNVTNSSPKGGPRPPV